MSIKVKSDGAYADITGVFHKRAGAYEAVQGVYVKAGGVYGRVDAAALLSALDVLSKYGANAYMWIPGVGMISGFDAKNWLNSNYTTPVAVDQQVGSVSSSSPAGTIGLTSANAAKRPYVRQAGGLFWWEFDGTDDGFLMSAAPFNASASHTVMMAVTPTNTGAYKRLFLVKNGSTSEIGVGHTAGNQFDFYWASGQAQAFAIPGTYSGAPVLFTAKYDSATKIPSVRVNANFAADGYASLNSSVGTSNSIGYNSEYNDQPYAGKMHGVVVIADQITHEETVVLEQFLAALSGATIAPDKARTYFNTADLMNCYMGDYTLTSGAYSMSFGGGALCMDIKAAKAEMYAKSNGSFTPYRVMADTMVFADSASPPGKDIYGVNAAAYSNIRKVDLFSGADTTRRVMIYSSVSTGDSNQFGLETHGKLLALTGDNVSVTSIGVDYRLADPACPAITTSPRVANAGTLPNFPRLTNGGAVWGGFNTASVHFRARFSELWVFAAGDEIEVSVNGGTFQRYSLTGGARFSISGVPIAGWRKISGLAGDGSIQSLMLCGSLNASTRASNVITGIKLVGNSPVMEAPTGTRRNVAILGDSIVEGIGIGACGINELHLAQDRLNIRTLGAGWAGKTIADGVSAMPTWAADVTNKDIIVLALGVNSTGDGAFQGSYQSLISAALTAGFQKVICKGLVQVADMSSSNAKIQAAVAAVADARVVYADVSTWTATTDGAGGSIAMPDAIHPSYAGYVTMANWTVRDHAALYA